MTETGFELVAARPFVVDVPLVRIPLGPGDRALVAAGESVVAGTPLVERLRDPRLEEVPVSADDRRRPGDHWSGQPGERHGIALRRSAASGAGELLFASAGRWRVVTGDHRDLLEAPVAGIVREVRPGVAVALEVAGYALEGAFAVGGPTRGRLDLATDPAGELRPGGLDVSRAGTILVVGSRVDAETLSRARAMGVKGVVVAALAGRDHRDFVASEARQRVALHRLPPFAVLVLDGLVRRPIASPVMGLLAALAGREVAIVESPPALLFEERPPVAPAAGWVRVRHGPLAGREGRWVGLAGPRRFAAGTHLEAGLVALDDGPPAAIPLVDLERLS